LAKKNSSKVVGKAKSKGSMSASLSHKKEGEVDREVDRAVNRAGSASSSNIQISERLYEAYLLFTAGMLNQTAAADKMGIRRQGTYKHAKKLELLGLIEPPDPNAKSGKR